MVARRKEDVPIKPRRPPATTPEAREQQMIAATFDLVEQRILNGTAAASETVHFLKLGTAKENLERQKLQNEVKLLEARAAQIESGEVNNEKLDRVLNALRSYQGQEDVEFPDEY